MRLTVLAVATIAGSALTASALAHETVADRGVAVTMHVLPDDEPVAGKPSTIVIVKVAPGSGKFTFKACSCRIKVRTASGSVLLYRRTGKRTPFVFPDPAAYEITYSGTYRARGGKTKRFSTAFAIRAN